MRLHDTEKLIRDGAKFERKEDNFGVLLFGREYEFKKLNGEPWRFAIFHDGELVATARFFDVHLVVSTPSGASMMMMSGREVATLTDQERCLIVSELVFRWFEK